MLGLQRVKRLNHVLIYGLIALGCSSAEEPPAGYVQRPGPDWTPVYRLDTEHQQSLDRCRNKLLHRVESDDPLNEILDSLECYWDARNGDEVLPKDEQLIETIVEKCPERDAAPLLFWTCQCWVARMNSDKVAMADEDEENAVALRFWLEQYAVALREQSHAMDSPRDAEDVRTLVNNLVTQRGITEQLGRLKLRAQEHPEGAHFPGAEGNEIDWDAVERSIPGVLKESDYIRSVILLKRSLHSPIKEPAISDKEFAEQGLRVRIEAIKLFSQGKVSFSHVYEALAGDAAFAESMPVDNSEMTEHHRSRLQFVPEIEAMVRNAAEKRHCSTEATDLIDLWQIATRRHVAVGELFQKASRP